MVVSLLLYPPYAPLDDVTKIALGMDSVIGIELKNKSLVKLVLLLNQKPQPKFNGKKYCHPCLKGLT